jgi:hypothetical protein
MVTSRIELNYPDEVLDTHTMASLSDEAYKAHVKDFELFFVDHHDVLRVQHAGFPLACNQRQLDILIDELRAIRHMLPTTSR